MWRAASELGAPREQIVRLLILTGCRKQEVAGMRRDELSDDGSTWTIPGSRTKNGRPHVLTLPASARELVSAAPAVSAEFVFSIDGRGPASLGGRPKKRIDAAATVAVALARPSPHRRHRHGDDRDRAARSGSGAQSRQRSQGRRRGHLQSRRVRSGEEGRAGAVGKSRRGPGLRAAVPRRADEEGEVTAPLRITLTQSARDVDRIVAFLNPTGGPPFRRSIADCRRAVEHAVKAIRDPLLAETAASERRRLTRIEVKLRAARAAISDDDPPLTAVLERA